MVTSCMWSRKGRYNMWVYLAVVILGVSLSYSGALAKELDCDVASLAGNYTLSGDLKCPVHTVTINDTVVIDVVNKATLDGVRFNVTEHAVLSFTGANLSITGCEYDAGSQGGALYVDTGGTAVFEARVTFVGNRGENGGALYISTGGEARFEAAATFDSNAAGRSAASSYGSNPFQDGGAIFVDSGGTATFKGPANFFNNTADHLPSGGAIYLHGTVTFGAPVSFVQNSATYYGGAICVSGGAVTFGAPVSFVQNIAMLAGGLDGGAIYLFGGEATFEASVEFVNNTCEDNGGAIFIDSAGTANFEGPVSFVDNSATYGGAMVLVNGTATFGAPVSFVQNIAKSLHGLGGAINLYGGTATFEAPVDFLNNSCTHGDGGAVWTEKAIHFPPGSSFNGNTAGGSGGGIYVSIVPNYLSPGDPLTFEDIFFFDNVAAVRGGAVCVDGCDSLFMYNVTAVGNSATDGGFVSALNCPLGWFDSTAISNTASGRGGALLLLLAPLDTAYNAPWLYSSWLATSYTSSSLSRTPAPTLSGTSYTSPSPTLSPTLSPTPIFTSGPAFYSPTISYSSSTTSLSSTSSITFFSSTILSSIYFESNRAGTAGGAVFVDSANILLKMCTFVGGTAASGGGIYFGAFLEAEMRGCTLDSNSAVSNGGALYVGTGTTLSIANSSITNSTSSTGAGGAIYADSQSFVTLTNVTIQHSLAALFGGGVGVQSSAAVNASTSLIRDSSSGCCFLNETQYTHTSNNTCSDLNYSGFTNSNCCLPEQYWNNLKCVQCESAIMDCSKVGILTDTIPLTKNNWRAVNYTLDIRQCLNPDACIGGNGTVGFTKDSQYCAVGYIGSYCAVCEDDFFSSPGRTCTKCANSLSAGMMFWTVILVTLFLCAIAASTFFLVTDQDDALTDARSKRLSRPRRWISKLGNLQWGRLRIPIVAAQIVSQCVAVTGVRLPSQYETFLAWFSFASLDFNMLPALDCLASTNFYDRLLFVTLLPLCGTFYLCLTYVVVVWKHTRVTAVTSFAARSGDDSRPARLEKAKSRHFRAFLILTFLVYSTVSATIFQAFSCDDVLAVPALGDSTNYTYLRVDYSIMCNTPQHTRYMIYAGVMACIYPLGIPALYAYLLWGSKEHFVVPVVVVSATQPMVDSQFAPSSFLQPTQESSLVGLESAAATHLHSQATTIASQHVMESSRFLWSGYAPRYYYWECIECLRRVVMTGLVVFLFPGTASQLSLTCIFAVASIVVISIFRPHADIFDFLLYNSGAVLVFLTMYLGLNMKVDVGNETAQSQAAFSALLITLHVGMMVAAFINMCLVAKATVDGRQQVLLSAVNLS